MRSFNPVWTRFWIGRTGRALRGDLEGQLLALYLLTSPHANLAGLYYVAQEQIALETGLTLEGVRKGLARLSEGGYCEYDDENQVIWVTNRIAHEFPNPMKPRDNRVSAIRRTLVDFRHSFLVKRLLHHYSGSEHWKPLHSPLEAPSEGSRGGRERAEESRGRTEQRGGERSPRQGPPRSPAALQAIHAFASSASDVLQKATEKRWQPMALVPLVAELYDEKLLMGQAIQLVVDEADRRWPRKDRFRSQRLVPSWLLEPRNFRKLLLDSTAPVESAPEPVLNSHGLPEGYEPAGDIFEVIPWGSGETPDTGDSEASE